MLCTTYSTVKLPHSYDDPGRVLEFIPLDELAIDGSISAGAEVVWRPAVQWSLDHHLFTEEEVFKYCVEANYTFPQYCSATSVVFIAQDLETSPILQELDKLESLWVIVLLPRFVAPHADKNRTTAQLRLNRSLGSGIFLRRVQAFNSAS